MKLRTILCALLLLSSTACDKEAAPKVEKEVVKPMPEVVATVGEHTFVEEDIDGEFNNLPERFQNMKENDGMRANVLSGMMTRTALTDKAVTLGVAEQPIVQSQLRQAQASILIQALHKDYLKKQQTPTEAEIQKYFDDNQQRFNKGEQVQARHILLKDEEQAKQVLNKLKKGDNFGKLAQTYSIDLGTKNNGGTLPPFEQGAMDPAFEKAAFALQNKDDISEIVPTRFGFHIIQLIGKVSPQESKLADVKEQIKNEMSQKSFQDWVETVKTENVFSVASERYKQHIKLPVVKQDTQAESNK